MSQTSAQQKKQQKSQQTADAAAAAGKTLQSSDRRQLVSTRTSPLIRIRFRNPIRTSVSGGGSDATRLAAAAGSSSTSAGGGGCTSRRRRSVDSASMSEKTGETGTSSTTTDDLGLEPRTRQYQKHDERMGIIDHLQWSDVSIRSTSCCRTARPSQDCPRSRLSCSRNSV